MSIFRFLARRSNRPIKRRQTSTVLLLEELEDRSLPSAGSSWTAGPTYQVLSTLRAKPLDGGSSVPGLSPAQIRTAYGIDAISFSDNGTSVAGNGAGETIAIVDAYDDPSIATDLATFDQQFNIAAPPSFTKVGINANGVASTTNFPTPDSGWAGEIELDVEWSHAIAPDANIILVEANSANIGDLLNAIHYAQNAAGVVAVSMSWGGEEFSGEQSYDSYFTTPAGHVGETFFASSGDYGAGTIWPSVSSHVVAAGGTTLTTDSAGDYEGESAWDGSGGGISAYVSAPSYQDNLQIYGGDPSADGMRTVPDVAYDADPNTGVAVYGSYGFGGWAQVGGTSASSPQWAALMSIVDQGRSYVDEGSLDGYTQTLPDLYALSASNFHDITTGSNGYPAGPGYDLATGLGSPIANELVPALGAPTAPQILTSVTVTPASTTVGDGGQQQFAALALDQFGRPMVQQPSFAWSINGAGTLSATGLYTAPATGDGSASIEATADGTTVDGTATANYSPGPAITSLSADPSPVTATSTTLDAAIADPNAGDIAYTWSLVSGPATPEFSSASGTTSAGPLSTGVTFSASGAYVFQLSITDANNLTATDQVSVDVEQTATAVAVTPATVSLGNGVQQQFSAILDDQFGNPMATQPTFSWQVTGLGTITSAGLYTSPASGSGSDTVLAQATVGGTLMTGSATAAYSPGLTIASLNANPNPVLGGTTTLSAVVSDPNSDSLYYTWSVLSAPAGVSYPTMSPEYGYATPGPLNSAVTFYGAGNYVFQLSVTDGDGMSTSATVPVTVTAQYPTITNIAANPSTVVGNTTTLSALVTDYNPGQFYYQWSVVSAPAGVSYPTMSAQYGWATSGTLSSGVTFYGAGSYQFQLTVTDSWGLSTTSTIVPVTVTAQYPTIANAAANPSTVVGNTTTLSALVTDYNPGQFYYQWSVVSAPAGVSYPTMSSQYGWASSGTLSSGVTFYGAGSYQFQLTVTDSWGLSTSQTVNVAVAQTATRITVSPTSAALDDGAKTTFAATVYDQFGNPFATQPTISWSVASGPGSITSKGVYTAPAAGGGTATIQAAVTVNGTTIDGTATVAITAKPTISSISASPGVVTGTSTTLSVSAADPGSTLSYQWIAVSGPAGAAVPTFSAGTSPSTLATFYKAGTYKFEVEVVNQAGLSATATVSVTVDQTLTSVTGKSVSVADGAEKQLSATAYDQFGYAITSASYTWSMVSGPGTVSSSGEYKAPASGTGRAIVMVTAVKNGVTVTSEITVTVT